MLGTPPTQGRGELRIQGGTWAVTARRVIHGPSLEFRARETDGGFQSSRASSRFAQVAVSPSCSGSRLKPRRLAFIQLFGSHYLHLSAAPGSD